MRNRSVSQFLNLVENKMVSLLPLSFFFLLPFIVSTLYFQKFKIHPLSVLVCAPHYPFLFSPTLLPRWNSGMTTKTKSCRGGHAGPASYGRCLSSIPEMYVSPFTILLCFFFFFGPFLRFANIFEIKCNCGKMKNLIFLDITFKN